MPESVALPDPPTCANCAHCNDEEADTRDGTAGICSLPVLPYPAAGRAYFAAQLVPVWLTGCPDHEPREVTP